MLIFYRVGPMLFLWLFSHIMWQKSYPGWQAVHCFELCEKNIILEFKMIWHCPCQPTQSFPGSSAGKESTCNAGDRGSIPGWGRYPGEGTGYPLQYSWDSLVAQLVKNPAAMWETWVRSLGWEDPLEKEKATHFSILAWRIPWTV